MRDVDALVQDPVGIRVAMTPGIETRQYVAAFARVAGQGQGGKGVQADAGGLQIVLDLVVSDGRRVAADARSPP